MKKSSLLSIVVSGLAAGLVACGGGSTPAQQPGQAPPESPAPASSSDGDGTARPTLTAQACEANGGAVQGDIGDGAIHRPEYRCPNGAKPSGSIAAPDGGPIAVEGAVCCPR